MRAGGDSGVDVRGCGGPAVGVRRYWGVIGYVYVARCSHSGAAVHEDDSHHEAKGWTWVHAMNLALPNIFATHFLEGVDVWGRKFLQYLRGGDCSWHAPSGSIGG